MATALSTLLSTSYVGAQGLTGISIQGTIGSQGAIGPQGVTPTTATTQSYGDATTNIATTAFVDAMRDVPANAQSANYTLVLSDRGKSIDFTGSTAQTITIPANTSVAFPVGSVVTFTNTTANTLSIAITTDTLLLTGSGTTGTRTLAGYGVATARKVAYTTWMVGGSGLS